MSKTSTQYSPIFPAGLFTKEGYVHPSHTFLSNAKRTVFPAQTAQAMSSYLLRWLGANQRFLRHLPEDRDQLIFAVCVAGEEIRVNVFRAVEYIGSGKPASLDFPNWAYDPDWKENGCFYFHVKRVLNGATGTSRNKFRLEATLIARPMDHLFYDLLNPYSSFRSRLNDEQYAAVRHLKEAGQQAAAMVTAAA